MSLLKKFPGRILIKLKGNSQPSDVLKNIFGLAYFAFAIETEQKIDAIENAALELIKDKKFETFKIHAKRAEKNFPLNSQQINEKVGEFVLKNLKKKIRVDLENPDIAVFIEIAEPYRTQCDKAKSRIELRSGAWADKSSFLYLEKIKGPGGLPAGSSGKGIVLISGGIDSPIAAYFSQKRGVETIYLHFHSYPYTSKNSVKRVEELIGILNKFQQKSKLILVPFAKIQQEIVSSKKIPEKLRVVLYRRFMFRIAEKIAEKEMAKVLITGESIGQVASQTLDNIKAVEEAVKIPVIRPLAGFDKEEIISVARRIGTYETSILPCDDTCSLFAPLHPETKADIKSVKLAEKNLDIKKLISTAVKNIEIKEV